MVSSSHATNNRACFFKVGPYALIIEGHFIKQVISPGRFSPVPRSSTCLWGLVAVESAIVPLINSYDLVGLAASKPKLAVVLEYQAKQLAFALDEVTGFLPLDKGLLNNSAASLLELPKVFKPFAAGLIDQHGEAFILINTPKLLELIDSKVELV